MSSLSFVPIPVLGPLASCSAGPFGLRNARHCAPFFRKGINVAGFTRFGRRIFVPSSLQIRTELRALVADENARERCAEFEGLRDNASWQEIVEHRSGTGAVVTGKKAEV